MPRRRPGPIWSADRRAPAVWCRVAPSALCGGFSGRAAFRLYMRVALSTVFRCAALPTWVGKDNVVVGSGAVLQSQQGCVTLHAVGASGPEPECLMHEVLPR